MKTKSMVWLGLAAVLVASPVAVFCQTPDAPSGQSAVVPDLSPGTAQVVKLAQSGVGDDVVLAYVQNSQVPFNLSADGVVYLKDLGVSDAVTAAMINHDKALPQPTQYNYDQRAYPPANPGAAPEPIYQPPIQAQPPVAQPDQSAPPPPAYVSNPPSEVNYFYNNLSPYGAWADLPGYGWCWQPKTVVVNRAWRPYCDGGHWVYSDAGWFWQSDYSWGWAPFHYGRWVMHPSCGWVWFPDTTWGPAWVVWRSSGDNCGWAPLPLHATFDVTGGCRFNGVRVGADFDFGLGINAFAFIGLRDFNNHDLPHRCLQPTEVTRIYNHTTIINNYTVVNRTFVNRGMDVNRVATATHAQFRPMAVRDLPAGNHETRGGGQETAVYRHALAAPARTVPVVAQRLDDRHPVIQHTQVAPANTARRNVPASDLQRQTPATTYQPQARPQPQPGRTQTQELPTQPRNQYQPPVQDRGRSGAFNQPVTPNSENSRPAVPPPQLSRPVVVEPNRPPANAINRQPSPAPTSGEPPNLVSHYYPPKSLRESSQMHVLPPPVVPAPTYQNGPAYSPKHSATVNESNPGNRNPGNNGNNGNNPNQPKGHGN
jgi:hypothetical protein